MLWRERPPARQRLAIVALGDDDRRRERTDLRASLTSIGAPTLVIAGADDPAAPPAQAELISRAIPCSRLAVVGRAAHLANVERPDEVNALILEHLLDASTEHASTKEAP